MGRAVDLLDVFADHARGAEADREDFHGLAHAGDPGARQTGLVSLVEGRNHVVLQHVIEGQGVFAILRCRILVQARRGAADSPAVVSIVALGPPAVEDREVQAAVDGNLLAARAAGLQRAARIVEPDVAAGDEHPPDLHVVILQKDHLALDPRSLGGLVEVLNEPLAAVVRRVGFPGKDHLEGPVGLREEPEGAFEVVEEQRGAFVGGKAPRKPDGQRVGVERQGVVEALLRHAFLDKIDQAAAQQTSIRPQVLVRDIVDGVPEIRIIDKGASVAHVPLQERPRRRGGPGRQVDAVGDMVDGDGVEGVVWIEMVPLAPRYLAVERRDGVGLARELQPQHRHRERFPRVVGMDPSVGQQCLLRQPDFLAEALHLLDEEGRDEAVVAGRHRRVRGEDTLCADPRLGVRVRHARRQALAQQFEYHEGAMALVEVIDAGFDTEGAQQAQAADAEDDLLPEAHSAVALVEPMGEGA